VRRAVDASRHAADDDRTHPRQRRGKRPGAPQAVRGGGPRPDQRDRGTYAKHRAIAAGPEHGRGVGQLEKPGRVLRLPEQRQVEVRPTRARDGLQRDPSGSVADRRGGGRLAQGASGVAGMSDQQGAPAHRADTRHRTQRQCRLGVVGARRICGQRG
jgi:hypothetical protein